MASTKENRTISDFKGALIGGGARNNLFEVELTTLPAGISWNASDFSYMCKAATLPASNVAAIDIPFRGRTFKVAGDRTIDTWTVTIINDESFNLRNAFEEWTDLIAKLDNNLGATDPEAYMVNDKVYQLGRGSTANSKSKSGTANSVLKEYEFYNIWPSTVAALDLSYDSTDSIEDFTVDFQVQSYKFNGAGGSNG